MHDHDSATIDCVWLESLVQVFLASQLSLAQVQKSQLLWEPPHSVLDVNCHNSVIIGHVWLESLVVSFLAS